MRLSYVSLRVPVGSSYTSNQSHSISPNLLFLCDYRIADLSLCCGGCDRRFTVICMSAISHFSFSGWYPQHFGIARNLQPQSRPQSLSIWDRLVFARSSRAGYDTAHLRPYLAIQLVPSISTSPKIQVDDFQVSHRYHPKR